MPICIAIRALGMEVVPYEVTSLMFWVFLFCFGLSGGFLWLWGQYCLQGKKYPPWRRKRYLELANVSDCTAC